MGLEESLKKNMVGDKIFRKEIDEHFTVAELMSILSQFDPDLQVEVYSYQQRAGQPLNMNCVWRDNVTVTLYGGQAGGKEGID